MPELDDEIDPAEIPDDLPYIETGCFAEGPETNLEIWTAGFLAENPQLAAEAAGEFAPLALARIYGWIDPRYSTMRRSGIVGDARHRKGYHRGRNVIPASDYSRQAPADKRGSGWACCGIDISFGPAEMKLATRRLMNACRTKDPRIEPLREFFGTLDGRRVTGWNRYPSSNRGVGYTTSSSSHLWHVHGSIFRDYADDEAKMRGIADVLNGVPLTQAPPPPDEGDNMPSAAEVAKAFAAEIQNNEKLKDAIAVSVRDHVFNDKVIPTYHRPPEGGWPAGGEPGKWALHSLLRSIRAEVDDIEKKVDALTAEATPVDEQE